MNGIIPESLFRRLLHEGIIEFIDCSEENTCVIANYPEELKNSEYTFTHCEIHPCVILGIGANMISFSDHSMSPRKYILMLDGSTSNGIVRF